jgi:hypothetical protein
MSELSEKYPWMTDTRYMGPAQVLSVDESGSYACLQLKRDFEYIETRARMAIPAPCKLYPGDTVLVMAEDPDHTYIIGILAQKANQLSSTDRIVLENGTHATRDEDSLKVFSHKKELIFEYDKKTGKSTVNLETGDIDFISRKGNINFMAGKDILLNGKTVGITSRTGIVMGIMDKLGKLKSALTIKSDNMDLNSPEVSIEAEKGDIKINETTITAKKLAANIDNSKLTVNRMETIAQTIISKAKNIYNTVEQLSQLKTGRMRTIVENTFHLKSRKAMLKSEDDFKVRAEKIHLG